MKIDEALSWLNSFSSFKKEKYDLNGVKCLLKKFGDLHKSLKFVHIAGTNGKGSTAKFCAAILVEAGFKTGLFISPDVLGFAERIQINGEFICEDELTEILSLVLKKAEELKVEGIHCSQFDLTFVAALIHFKTKKCSIVVLETGLGGRLDSTNVIEKPEIAIITHIAEDHKNELGGSIEEIAKEKAGILKRGSVCVLSCNQQELVKKIFKERCATLKIPLIESSKAQDVKISLKGSFWKFDGMQFQSSLIGKHQIENAMTALTAMSLFKIKKEIIVAGIKKATNPVRFEVLKKDDVVFILDGAHNVDGISSLLNTLHTLKIGRKIGIFSMLKTKEYFSVIKQIKSEFESLIVTQMANSNAVAAQELGELAAKEGMNVMVEDEVKLALKLAEEMAREKGAEIVVFGSIYFMSEVRANLS